MYCRIVCTIIKCDTHNKMHLKNCSECLNMWSDHIGAVQFICYTGWIFGLFHNFRLIPFCCLKHGDGISKIYSRDRNNLWPRICVTSRSENPVSSMLFSLCPFSSNYVCQPSVRSCFCLSVNWATVNTVRKFRLNHVSELK